MFEWNYFLIWFFIKIISYNFFYCYGRFSLGKSVVVVFIDGVGVFMNFINRIGGDELYWVV